MLPQLAKHLGSIPFCHLGVNKASYNRDYVLQLLDSYSDSAIYQSGLNVSFLDEEKLPQGFSIVNEAEDVFLDFFCFLSYPIDFCNLISGSSAFSKSSLNIWQFSVHVLVKPSW